MFRHYCVILMEFLYYVLKLAEKYDGLHFNISIYIYIYNSAV